MQKEERFFAGNDKQNNANNVAEKKQEERGLEIKDSAIAQYLNFPSASVFERSRGRHEIAMRWVCELLLVVAVEAVIDKDYNSIEEERSMELPSSAELTRPARYRNCTRDTDIIDQLLNGTGYNKFRIPQDEGMTVSVEIWIQAITSIDELTNDFDMDIYITERWLDPALNFENLSPCKGNLSLNHQVLDRLWTPNSCFINSKVAHIHESPFRSVFLMLFPNGSIMVNYRVRVKGPCSMELSNFPLDLQKCGLIYESFNYNNQEVRMRWSSDTGDPVRPMAEIVLPDFDLFKITANRIEEPYPAGMWDELHVSIMFERRFIWYFMQAYLPTYLTIFISWVSFALGPRAIPARTMLGVNALLAMIFQFGNIMRNLPRVSYIKAIDVWMLASMTFIFCSLLELAIVGYMVRDENKTVSKSSIKKSKPLSDESPRGSLLYEKRFMLPAGCNAPRSISKTSSPWPPEKIDTISSIMFPLSFFIFNIVYWSYYLQRKQEISDSMQKL
ncbi:unnamed protein product [Cylicocyclus nassatus]|uniref:Uncharacterized protein n=1 Tax=Cylicocyclus nassatus TaxID=53992 RepID=A0AA36H0D4_CYLNA|nr:unnamed protein product [Cylicocyclus nassatus]